MEIVDLRVLDLISPLLRRCRSSELLPHRGWVVIIAARDRSPNVRPRALTRNIEKSKTKIARCALGAHSDCEVSTRVARHQDLRCVAAPHPVDGLL